MWGLFHKPRIQDPVINESGFNGMSFTGLVHAARVTLNDSKRGNQKKDGE